MRRLEVAAREAGGTLFVALNGSQGSGKSTLCAYLCAALESDAGLKAVSLSLDDVYLTHAERQRLGERVHPLLRTRGVPGTHDLDLLERTLDQLGATTVGTVAVPRFDKSVDDRHPRERWSEVTTPLDVVLLEGWCLGTSSVADQELESPLNDLERLEDTDGTWRRYVNSQLREHYEALYERMDFWVMLAAPGFETVLRWRTEQEHKLAQAVQGRGDGLMSDQALQRFVAHFERCTRQCLATLPAQVDVLLQLDGERRIVSSRGLESPA